jgi:hypothetical protein
LIGHDTAASIVCVKLEDVLDLLLCKDSRFRHFVKSGSVKREGKGRRGGEVVEGGQMKIIDRRYASVKRVLTPRG